VADAALTSGAYGVVVVAGEVVDDDWVLDVVLDDGVVDDVVGAPLDKVPVEVVVE